MAQDRILINRAPVLTLWAAVVAERLGFDREEALSLGKAVKKLHPKLVGALLLPGLSNRLGAGRKKSKPTPLALGGQAGDRLSQGQRFLAVKPQALRDDRRPKG